MIKVKTNGSSDILYNGNDDIVVRTFVTPKMTIPKSSAIDTTVVDVSSSIPSGYKMIGATFAYTNPNTAIITCTRKSDNEVSVRLRNLINVDITTDIGINLILVRGGVVDRLRHTLSSLIKRLEVKVC